MPDKDNTGAPQPDGSQLKPADVAPTVPPVTPPASAPAAGPDGMTLAELNALTGKSFPTKDAALKSIKDTFSYVGKKKEDVRAEVLAEISTTNSNEALSGQIAELRKEAFFDKNPQYADPEVRSLINKLGANPAEVVNTPEFKAIFTKVAGYNDGVKLKTVLESNPRIATSRDNLSKAAELQQNVMKSGSYSGAGRDQVETLAVGAVKAAFGL